MLKICVLLVVFCFLLFSFWCISKEAFDNNDPVLDFVEKIQNMSGNRLVMKEKKIYNPDMAFVELESRDGERVLFSVFLKKRYGILERIWFVRDEGYMTKNQEIYRIIDF